MITSSHRSQADINSHLKRFIRPYYVNILWITAVIFVISAISIVPPLFLRLIVDDALPRRSISYLLACVLGMISFGVLGSLFGLVEGKLNVKFAEELMRDMRQTLMAHLVHVPIDFYQRTPQSDIVNRVLGDIDSVEATVLATVSSTLGNITALFLTIIALFLVDRDLGALAIFLLLPITVPLLFGARRLYFVRRMTREQRDILGHLTQDMFSHSGICLMKLFNQEIVEQERYSREARLLSRQEIRLQMTTRVVLSLTSIIQTIAPALIWFFGAIKVLHDQLSIGSLVAISAYLVTITLSIDALSSVGLQISSVRSLFERIFQYLEEPQEEHPGGVPLPSGSLGFSFRDLQVSYKAGYPVLFLDTFDLEPGIIVGLVGPSGAGKTTLVNVILRLTSIEKGQVFVNGIDYSTICNTDLRNAISIVPQEPVIFNDTLRANLCYGNITFSDKEIEEALKDANLGELIFRLRAGLETVLGESGSMLSSGERKRIAIARTILRKPRVIIYDEATSALDAENETLILEGLRVAAKGRLTIVVAHTLSALAIVDRIVVLHRGRVVETGSVAQLSRANGYFASQHRTHLEDGISPGSVL